MFFKVNFDVYCFVAHRVLKFFCFNLIFIVLRKILRKKMGQIFGKDAKPLITFSCINVRDADNINITHVDGKEKREEKKKRKKKK